MNKKELIEIMAVKTNIQTKTKVEEFLNIFIGIIKETLKKGDKITITGFGTFSVSKRASRMGINPQTKERIKISATKVPKFKAGKDLKIAIK